MAKEERWQQEIRKIRIMDERKIKKARTKMILKKRGNLIVPQYENIVPM
jgi:hypothetical protein